MKLREALTLSQTNKRVAGEPLSVFLACGFTPLHLPVFLAAHAMEQDIGSRLEIETGTYGDICTVVEEIAGSATDAVVVLLLEYADLDPRFGLRRSGTWSKEAIADAVATAVARLARVQTAIQALSGRIAVLLPTLPLPPLFATGGWQSAAAELELKAGIATFAAAIARRPNVVICREEHLAALSPVSERRDAQAELVADFPYSLAHAAAVAAVAIQALFPPVPLKGVITDLDDTLWRGLVGEVGHRSVNWSLEEHSQTHALYQQTLQALAEQGILVGVASKNDARVVAEALARTDLLVAAKHIFPVEASWGQKSQAVGKILESWNIGADAVVFVDDNPLELEEVSRSFPAMRTMLFPTRNDGEALRMLRTLRDLFHREVVTQEDLIRLESLRAAQQVKSAANQAASQDDFLATLDSRITIAFAVADGDARPLELVNKTNQFNLNGRRLTEPQWRDLLRRDDAWVAVVSYTDKFGPLGRVSVLFGRRQGGALRIEGWVLSCRAFSRRIEHAVLRVLFTHFDVRTIELDFTATDRNGPLQDFVRSLLTSDAAGAFTLQAEQYAAVAPTTHHAMVIE